MKYENADVTKIQKPLHKGCQPIVYFLLSVYISPGQGLDCLVTISLSLSMLTNHNYKSHFVFMLAAD